MFIKLLQKFQSWQGAVLALFLFASVLSIKRDGFFPLSSEAPLWLFILVNFVILGLFLAVILQIFNVRLKLPAGFRLQPFSLLALGSVWGTGLLLWHSARAYGEIYQLDMALLILVTVISSLVIIFTVLSGRPWFIISGLVIVTVLLYTYVIISIPLSARLADLLPIVSEQGRAFLRGESIYQYFLLDNGIWTQAVRQPGVMLAYLPALLLDIDPRILSLVFQLGGGFLLFELAYPGLKGVKLNGRFSFVLMLLTLYLLLPYRVLRGDLYDPPYWFLMLFSLWALVRKRYLLWSIVNGLAIATQIWAWIMLPFFILYIYREKLLLKRKIIISSLTIAIGGLLLALFVLPDPAAYLEHVFGFYEVEAASSEYPLVTVFLTPLVFELGLGAYLKYIQFLGCALVGVYALFRMREQRSLILSIVLVVMVFIQFNIISWAYMYLIIFYLMLFYLLWRSHEDQKSSHPGRRVWNEDASSDQSYA